MKKMRKGFTLVELLIVVAILAILSATMMVSMSGITAKAKAASIAANLDACRAAAILYYAKHGDENGFDTTATTETMLKAELATWESMADSTATIYYVAGTDSTATNHPDDWAVKVDFSGDPEKAEIAKHLKNIKGYSEVVTTAFAGDGIFDLFGATPAYAADATATSSTTSLFMTLITGKITVGDSGFNDASSSSGGSTGGTSTESGQTTGQQ